MRLAVGVSLVSVYFAANTSAFADESSPRSTLSSVATPDQSLVAGAAVPPPASPLTPSTDSTRVTISPATLAVLAAAEARIHANDAAPSATHSFLAGIASKASDVVGGALNMIGVRYRWGGNTPDSGLDCSGFVRYVFQDTLGLTLPRRAEEMSRVGVKVSLHDLKPGDLVFFNTMRRQLFSHVGIYIGDNKFVHSPSTGSTIRVDDLDNGYWEKRLISARRVDVSYKPDAADAASSNDIPTFQMIKAGSDGSQ